ncbi:MAG: tetratricopeptide repeat protein [Pseudomonadota bacterium]
MTWRVMVRAALLASLLWPALVAADESRAGDAQHHEAIAQLLEDAADHLARNDFEASSAAVERALRIDPNDASLWRLLGDVRERQGRSAQAAASYARADALSTPSGDPAARDAPQIVAAEDSGADNQTNRPGARLAQSPNPRLDPAWSDSRAALWVAIANFERRADATDRAAANERGAIIARLRALQRERERLQAALRTFEHYSVPSRSASNRPQTHRRHWRWWQP